MKLALVGPSYQDRSLPFDAQRSVNLYPVIDETGQGKEISALYGTPGLSEFTTAGDGPIRGCFASANGRAFVVSGINVYELASDGTATLRGTMVSTTSLCSIAENATQLGICDGTTIYVLTYATNAFGPVTDGDFPGAATLTFQDQYFIVNKPNSAEAYISALGNGNSWDALDFATAESSPDNLVRVFSAYGQLWLFGELSTEIWYNSGDANFPFVRVEGAKMQIGCAAAHTVVDVDNSVYWLGVNKDGTGIVYMAQGYTPMRISTRAIEKLISEVEDKSVLRAYSYQEEGHLFYVLTGDGLTTTLVYDVSTRQWHERAYLEPDGTFSTHRGSCHMFAFEKHLVGDKETGKVYEQSLSYYDDDGNEILRQRTFTHLYNEAKRFNVHEIQVDFEYGVGLTSGQGSDPICYLELSGDGGRTFGNQHAARIGAKGEFNTRAVWRRLGQYRSLTGRVSISDPVKVVICGAYLQ